MARPPSTAGALPKPSLPESETGVDPGPIVRHGHLVSSAWRPAKKTQDLGPCHGTSTLHHRRETRVHPGTPQATGTIGTDPPEDRLAGDGDPQGHGGREVAAHDQG